MPKVIQDDIATGTICLCIQCGHSFQLSPEIAHDDWDRIESELSRHNHEIDKLRQTLAALEKGRDALLQMKYKPRTKVSPVSQLPAELLGEIFSWCAHLPERDEAELARTHRRQNKAMIVLTLPILSIAQTCSLWRQVSFSRPDFWTDIIIRLDAMYETFGALRSSSSEGKRLLGLLVKYLDYSKSLPLTIDLHAFGPLTPRNYNTLSSNRVNGNFFRTVCCILTMLSVQMFRWRQVIVALDRHLLRRYPELLQFSNSLGTPIKAENISQNVPLLESFTIIFDEFDNSIMGGDWRLPLSVHLHSAVPRLRRLFIPHAPINEGISYFPWSQLTSLTVDSLQDNSCGLLKHCSQLENFRILHYACGDSFPNDHPYLLPMLTKLEICMSTDSGSSDPDVDNRLDLFAILTLPSLSTLIITVDALDPASLAAPRWNQGAFREMTDRASFTQTLKRLSLSNIIISCDDLQDLLSMTPSLTHFSYTSARPKENHPAPHLIGYIRDALPHLTHLELRLPDNLDDGILDSICSMLDGSKLESLALRAGGGFVSQLDSHAKLQSLATVIVSR